MRKNTVEVKTQREKAKRNSNKTFTWVKNQKTLIYRERFEDSNIHFVRKPLHATRIKTALCIEKESFRGAVC